MNNNSLVLSSFSKIKSSESSFYSYLQEIQKFPMLSVEEEYEYEAYIIPPVLSNEC